MGSAAAAGEPIIKTARQIDRKLTATYFAFIGLPPLFCVVIELYVMKELIHHENTKV
jgi:hypothetical protein